MNQNENVLKSGWTRSTPPQTAEAPTTEAPTIEQAVIFSENEAGKQEENEAAAANDARLQKNNPSQQTKYPTSNTKSFNYGWMTSDAEFRALLKQVSGAIRDGIHPERIRQGSSGSYFVLDGDRHIIGVFKPKTEEPYGHLNPKMIKYLHRTCCPCFFGRSCIIPNTGFLSEAAASVVDRQLGLHVVPRTEIVKLAAPSFHYGYWARMRAQRKNGRFPEKIGSFQMFVTKFKDSTEVMPEIESSWSSLAPELKVAFQREFERMVILDFIIRNTDRSTDNWMIYIGWPLLDGSDEENLEWCLVPESTKGRRPVVKIAAIDNGLAFPFKHPDNIRAYPYSWLSLELAKQPFSDQTCAEFIPIVSDPSSWDSIIESLRLLFQADPFEYDERAFNKQMSILRGQLHNLLEALIKRESPAELAQKTPVIIEEDENFYVSADGQAQGGSNDMLPYAKRMKKKPVESKPWFSFW
jgi:phosphatidylinositol 4-kinase type 2